MTFRTLARRTTTTALAFVALGGATACSLDTGAPNDPKSIVGGSSANVAVKTGAPTTLSVFVLNNYGEPITGATVTFTLTTGAGTLSATSVPTTSQGLAQAVFTPSRAGTSLVDASVPGLRAITFSIVASD